MSCRLLFDRVESRAMGRPPRDMRSPLDRRSNQLFNVGRTIGLIMAHLMAHALMAHALMSDPELGRRAHLLGRRKSWPRTQCARATPAATAGAGSLMAVMMRHTARARDQPNRLMLRGQSMMFMHATPSSPLLPAMAPPVPAPVGPRGRTKDSDGGPAVALALECGTAIRMQ